MSWKIMVEPCLWTASTIGFHARAFSPRHIKLPLGTHWLFGVTIIAPETMSPTPPLARSSIVVKSFGVGLPTASPRPSHVADRMNRFGTTRGPKRFGVNKAPLILRNDVSV